MNPLADALRKRQEAERLRGRGLQFQNVANNAGAPTVGGGMVGGMRGGQVAPEAINWGSIIQSGVGNYQAAKSNAQAEKAEIEADELSQAFMADTFKNDPESFRLMQMAQAGVPGAEQALAERVNPKKEALGAFLQHLQYGVADEALVAELAPRYGVSPELASTAVATARKRQEEQEAAERAQGLEDYERKMQIQARYRPPSAASTRAAGEISFEEYMAMSPEQREAYDKYKGRRGSSTEGNLTPGELQIRGRALKEAEENHAKMQSTRHKFEALNDSLSKNPDAFNNTQRVAQWAAESELPVLSSLGTYMRSPEMSQLEQAVNDEVLARMAQLGGNDSNEELRRMRASLPQALNNKEAAKVLLRDMEEFSKTLEKAMELRRRDLQSGDYFQRDAEPKDYYAMARSSRKDVTTVPTATSPDPVNKPKIRILSIE